MSAGRFWTHCARSRTGELIRPGRTARQARLSSRFARRGGDASRRVERLEIGRMTLRLGGVLIATGLLAATGRRASRCLRRPGRCAARRRSRRAPCRIGPACDTRLRARRRYLRGARSPVRPSHRRLPFGVRSRRSQVRARCVSASTLLEFSSSARVEIGQGVRRADFPAGSNCRGRCKVAASCDPERRPGSARPVASGVRF